LKRGSTLIQNAAAFCAQGAVSGAPGAFVTRGSRMHFGGHAPGRLSAGDRPSLVRGVEPTFSGHRCRHYSGFCSGRQPSSGRCAQNSRPRDDGEQKIQTGRMGSCTEITLEA